MNLYQNSIAPTYRCSKMWEGLTRDERIDLVGAVLASAEDRAPVVAVTDASEDGQVTLSFLEPVGADKRGTILLDLEERLKMEADMGITVWLEPLGDKSALRKLRGIEVK